MGLLIFKERAPDDKSPYRKNEFHVGVSARANASNKPSFSAISDGRANTRSPIRRELTRRDRARLRRLQRSNSANSAAEESFIEWLLPTASPRSRALMDYVMQQGASDNRAETERGNISTDSTSQVDNSRADTEPSTQGMDGSELAGSQHDGENVDSPPYSVRTHRFPPASQFYEALQREQSSNDNIRPHQPTQVDTQIQAIIQAQFQVQQVQQARRTLIQAQDRAQREQHFDVTRAEARGRTTNSRPGSPERVASPDTQQAILRQIENQSDLARFSSRLYVDGAETSTTAPQMRISRSDGLGDRRRSLSNDDERPSSAEENWNSLMATIPQIDDDLPSASSSFASDSASSILSRAYPRSSMTNTSFGSRSASLETAALRSPHCPETNDSSQTIRRSHGIAPSLVPTRASQTPLYPTRLPRAAGGLSVNDSYRQRQLNTVSDVANHGLDNLDLMDMLNNGMEIPADMWASVGITPHLGLRGGSGRLQR